MVGIFRSFWWWSALLGVAGGCSAFLLKNTPVLQRRLPNLGLSIALFAVPPVLFVMPPVLNLPEPFHTREAIGVWCAIAGSAIGMGLADWMLSRKSKPAWLP